MNYDTFKTAVHAALHDARLVEFGFPTETLNLRGLDRTYSLAIEPVGGQDAEPFHVTGIISWRWDVFNAARTATCEEDLLTELLGRERAYETETEKLHVRMDVVLRATLMVGHEIRMPTSAAWQKWADEVMTRLASIEPLVPEDINEIDDDGRMSILAWQGAPEATVLVAVDGDLKLSEVKVEAFEMIEIPRVFDDREREPDDDPGDQLVRLFRRVKASLHGWMESLDHLVP